MRQHTRTEEGFKDLVSRCMLAVMPASPLGKRYGWGTHHDAEGRVALVALGSSDYERLASDSTLTHRQAMRSRRG